MILLLGGLGFVEVGVKLLRTFGFDLEELEKGLVEVKGFWKKSAGGQVSRSKLVRKEL